MKRKIDRLVDTVQVVRCKDCQFCLEEGENGEMEAYHYGNYWYCDHWGKGTSVYGTDPERFYCADGERREEHEDSQEQ